GANLARRRDRAGTDDDVRQLLGDPRDRRQRGLRAERDLDRAQAAGEQRSRERDGERDVVDRDDGDDRVEVEQLVGRHAGAAAPRGSRAWSAGGASTSPASAPSTEAPASAGPASARRVANSCRPPPRGSAATERAAGGRLVRSAPRSSRVPASQSRAIRSPLRTRASGPPANASGVQWIAAGTLPEAPDMRPSVTIATC